MVTWADAHRLGMLEAGRLLRTLGVDSSVRVPVETVADQLGLVVHYKPLPRLAGAYVTAANSPPGILVNSRLPWSKQRFTLAHEIGHHRFSHESTLDLDVGSFNRRLSDQERVAEAFGAWLLMPPKAIRAATSRRPISSPDDLYQLSLRLGVSYQAACVHMTNTRVLDYPTAEAWRAVPPKTFKQRLLRTDALLGAPDVHLVDETADGSTIHVQPGDTLAFPEVDEISVLGDDPPFRVSHEGADTRAHVEAEDPANPGEPMDRFEILARPGDDQYRVAVVVERKRLGVHYRWFEE